MSKQEEHLYSHPHIQHFIKKAESVRMTRHEKRLVFNAITRKVNLLENAQKISQTSFISKATETLNNALGKKTFGHNSLVSVWGFISHNSKRTVAAGVVIMLALASFGTTYAAENALPGDVLYGVKINVNEEVKSFVAVGDDAKAKVAVSLAKKRLEEAEALSATGKLNANTQSIIKDNFKKHTETIKQKVNSLKVQKNNDAIDDVVSSLASGIKAHESILTSIKSSTNKDTGEQIDQLIDSVKNDVTENIIPSISNDNHSDLVVNEVDVKNLEDSKKDLTSKTGTTTVSTTLNDSKSTTTLIGINATSTSVPTSSDVNTTSVTVPGNSVIVDFVSNESKKTNSDLNLKNVANSTTTNNNVDILLDAISNGATTTKSTSTISIENQKNSNVNKIKQDLKTITTISSQKSNISQGELEVKQKAVLSIITDVKISTNEASLSGDQSLLTQNAEEKLKQAQVKINEAKDFLNKKMYREALESFAQAKSLALEAQTFAQVHSDAPSEVINLLKAK